MRRLYFRRRVPSLSSAHGCPQRRDASLPLHIGGSTCCGRSVSRSISRFWAASIATIITNNCNCAIADAASITRDGWWVGDLKRNTGAVIAPTRTRHFALQEVGVSDDAAFAAEHIGALATVMSLAPPRQLELELLVADGARAVVVLVSTVARAGAVVIVII